MDVDVYTRARRHPLQQGSIGDIPIPAAHWWQFAAAAATLLVIVLGRGVWDGWPLQLRVPLLLAGPVLAFWLSGKVRPDGVQPFAAAAGWAGYAAGRYGGFGSGARDRRRVRVTVRLPAVKTNRST